MNDNPDRRAVLAATTAAGIAFSAAATPVRGQQGAPEPTLGVRFLCQLNVLIEPPIVVGKIPNYGTRTIVITRGGTFEGPRLRGELLPGNGDAGMILQDSTVILDARRLLRTDDGALIYLTFRGIRHGPAEVLAKLIRGEPVDPSQYYFRGTASLETGSEKYEWVNRTVVVGTGDRTAAGPRYTLFEIL